jgi:hypothetical protein
LGVFDRAGCKSVTEVRNQFKVILVLPQGRNDMLAWFHSGLGTYGLPKKSAQTTPGPL